MEFRGIQFPDDIGGLDVGEMAAAADDTVLQFLRVAAIAEHFLVVVSFEESHVALAEVGVELLAVGPDISHDADIDASDFDAEAAWVLDVVRFCESMNLEIADRERVAGLEELDTAAFGTVFNLETLECSTAHEGRHLISVAEPLDAVDMVRMLVTNEDSTDFADVQATAAHSLKELAETDTYIDDNSLVPILNVIGVAIATGSNRTYLNSVQN